MRTNKTALITDSGEPVEATAPVIISASRSTDIPAFYAKWFFHRLARGYCAWYNPFSGRKSYVSFKRCRAVVFWTKNPRPILPYLPELDRRGIHYYFQMTLNDYEREGFEPGVPPLRERIETFKELSKRIGRERVIWRFDPLMLAPGIDTQELLRRVSRLGSQLKGYTDKLVISFIDINAYRKVRRNLTKETNCFTESTVASGEFTRPQMEEIADGLAKLRASWRTEGWNLTLATCAETIDLDAYGIAHNRCVDGELMKRLFADDKEFVHYLNADMTLKDKGQRKACGCMVSKDIGMYDTCRHFCVYCYANSGKESVLKNALRHSDEGESLIER